MAADVVASDMEVKGLMESEPEVPKIVMSHRVYACPTCHAAVSCYVDIFAAKLEVFPDEMELHLQWHDRNDK